MEARRPRPCWFSEVERKYEYRRTLPHYQPDEQSLLHYLLHRPRWISRTRPRRVLKVCIYGNGKKFRLHRTGRNARSLHIVLTPVG